MKKEVAVHPTGGLCKTLTLHYTTYTHTRARTLASADETSNPVPCMYTMSHSLPIQPTNNHTVMVING
jgi:hypothetical protein